MDHLKEAFRKVKEDVLFLKEEVSALRKILFDLKETSEQLCEIIKNINDRQKRIEELQKEIVTDQHKKAAIQHETPTDKVHFSLPKDQNSSISTGNKGVPTDRQTDRPADRQTQKNEQDKGFYLNNALDLLNSLDSLKKELRLKIKKLTTQEFLVFSTIYQLDLEKGGTNYKELSPMLNLTESSVRDYIGKIMLKGLPVEKKKINNKTILLLISPDFKRVASLPTLLQLRDL